LRGEYEATFDRLWFREPGADFAPADQIGKLLATGRYQILHAVDSFEGVALAAARYPEVAAVQNVFPDLRNSPYRPPERWLSDPANPYAALVTEIGSNLCGLPRPGRPPHLVVLIANGVDTEFWSPDAAPRTTDCCWVGRAESAKGVDVLMELVRRLPRVAFCLVTNEADHTHHQQLVDLEREVQNFSYHWSLAAEPLRAVYRRSRLYLHTSRSEGMSGALLEAMACGCVPLVAATGGPLEVLAERPASLVQPGEHDSFAQRLVEHLATDTEPEAAAVRQLVVERYDVDRMVDSYLELYLRIAGEWGWQA
jgi:glycosyltransferase involved in cell wall biosynthesis